MSSFFTISMAQIFFPLFIGIGFVFFHVESERVKKIGLYGPCFLYFLLSGLLIVVLIMEPPPVAQSFDFLDGPFFYPQKGLAKWILLSPLGYFLQLKKIKDIKENFLMNIFFQGIFFTLFNLSLHVKGGLPTYCVLELLTFSAIMLSMVNNNLWSKNNLILQGLGTAFILISLIIISALTKMSGVSAQIETLTKAFGLIHFKEMLSFFLILGILLKSSMIEYEDRYIDGIKRMVIYLLIVKLYTPIRFLFENDIFQMMELNTMTKWIILLFCLGNCLKVTKKIFRFEILQLVKLFSGFILLGFTMLGSEGLHVLVKYSFCIALLFMFYISEEEDEKNRPFGLMLLMLSAVAITGIFYLFQSVSLVDRINGPFLFITIVILYLMTKYLWNAIVVSLRKINFNFSLESYFIQNIIVMTMIWILIEFDLKFFVENNIWPS